MVAKIETPVNDSLGKYSYLVFQMEEDSVRGVSTGFFIKRGENVIFVTTNHSCTCYDYVNQRPYPKEWSLLILRLYMSSGKILYPPIKMSLGETKLNRPMGHFSDYPDMCSFLLNDLPDSLKSNINFINDVVNLNDIINTEPSGTIYFGYSSNPTDTSFDTFSPIKVEGTMYVSIHTGINFEDIGKRDVNSYVIKSTAKFGESGAPVFFKYYDSITQTNTIKFGGMVFGVDSVAGYSFVLKSRYILQAIDERLKSIHK